MSTEDHRALKSWERGRQRASLHMDPNLTGPPAWCRIKGRTGASEGKLPVFILQIFAKDLVCVKAYTDPFPEGAPGPFWLVRGGIDWEGYLEGVVMHYRAGMPVPPPFEPRKKIGSDLISRLSALPASDLPAVFQKMRESGILPGLSTLTRLTCPGYLPWESLRAHFQDFRSSRAMPETLQG
jgi:hypothetical protein